MPHQPSEWLDVMKMIRHVFTMYNMELPIQVELFWPYLDVPSSPCTFKVSILSVISRNFLTWWILITLREIYNYIFQWTWIPLTLKTLMKKAKRTIGVKNFVTSRAPYCHNSSATATRAIFFWHQWCNIERVMLQDYLLCTIPLLI